MRATASPAPESSASSSAGPPTERDAPRVARTTMNVRPLHDRIIIERIEESEQRVGGIIIPDTAKEKPLQAEVVAVGPGRMTEEGKRITMDVKKGDKILIGKYSGTEVKIEGDEFVILREDDVLAIVG
jgi:chaperonin GroES